MGDEQGAHVVARICAGIQVEGDEWEKLEEPWRSAAEAVLNANGRGKIDVLRAFCEDLPGGKTVFKTVTSQDPRAKSPRQGGRPVVFAVPPLPSQARIDPGLDRDAAVWVDYFVDYAKRVSPRTPDLFHVANGLWLVSLAVARRVVLRLSHKDVFPNLAILQVAPTTLYAKSTGMNVPRFLAASMMRHLLLPGAMTPEEMYSELAGHQPTQIEDLETWNLGRAYAGQRGVCLDEASSVFTGLKRDYNVGMNELLCRLYDCIDYDARQTRGLGRIVVRDAYWSFLGATTPWHLRQADVESLWHTGLWPRFLLLTPPEGPIWATIQRDRVDVPAEVTVRLKRLLEEDLPESKYNEAPTAVGMGLGEGVFDAWTRYCEATMHTMIAPPSTVDGRLYGVYGRLPEHALKISMLLAALEWNGNGAPVIEKRHWAWAQGFAEQCRASAHRLPGLLDARTEDEEEEKVLARLYEFDGEWCSARDVYKPLKLKSSVAKSILLDLVEADLVEERAITATRKEYRVKRDDESL